MKNVERDDDLHLHMIGILSDKTIHFCHMILIHVMQEKKQRMERIG
jgi:hypothetical protein